MQSDSIDPLEALRRILSNEQLGKLLFLYYRYLNNFHRVPIDFDDMIDGTIYLSLITEQADG